MAKEKTKTAVDGDMCFECGVDIRPEAMFCYNCGSAVDADAAENDEISDAWFRESISEGEESDPDDGEKENNEEAVESVPSNSAEFVNDDTGTAKAKRKAKIRRKPKLKSAGTIRKNGPKSHPRKKVEVVWEANENSPNLWFILASVVLVAIVGVFFYLARVLQ
ncbi:MAG: zinc ribbon domain-containing protein [Pyrinomonadaceae bacterium]